MSPSVSSAIRFLQLLLRARPATLLLLICLQLGLSEAQENTTRKIIIYDLSVSERETADDPFIVKLHLETELKECMVINTYLKSDIPIEGTFNYIYTRCLCEDSPTTFFWDVWSTRTARIVAMVDIIREKGICPEDLAVVPITANQYTFGTLVIN